MPVKPCESGGKSGLRWGDRGTCYTGPDARRKANAQAAAAHAGGYAGHSEHRPEPDERPEAYRLPRVEYFATGYQDGEHWTKADLEEIARNFHKFKGKLDPPLVVGHEDDQQLLDATDVPAAGWPDDLKVEWDPEDREWKLVGPVEGVPPEVADWIDRGLYRRVSAEIYDDSAEADLEPGHGKMLRRVALLGGELPKVKILRRLPRPERSRVLPFAATGGRCLKFSERKRPGKGLRRITFFSERRRMDRNQLAQAALAIGIPQSAIDKLDDKELATVCQARMPLSPEPPEGGGNFAEGEPPAPDPDAMDHGNYAEQDMDPDPTPGGEDDPANPRPAGSYAEGPPAKPARDDGPGVQPATRNYSDEDPRGTGQARPSAVPPAPADDEARRTNGQVAKMYSETQRMLGEMRQLFKTYQADVSNRRKIEAQASQANKARTVRRYCERWREVKKVFPYEIDPEGPRHNVFNRLLRASTKRVHKFSEKGRAVARSDFDLLVEEIEARDPKQHVRFFSEKMAQPQAAGQGGLSPERRLQLLNASTIGRAVAKQIEAKAKAQ